MIQKIPVEQFLLLATDHPLLDVRSPSEYNHAHIPGAYSLPLFNDDERKVVGTAYKQHSREQAIKIGLDYFGVKMRRMLEEVEGLMSGDNKAVFVHCWRGGMRSEGVAWLLELYGFKVYTLSGGYKAFRNWVFRQFNLKYELKILGGYTGSGKTLLLKELERLGHLVIDLERLANHKGSVFGGLGEKSQPSQEMFENLLASELFIKASLAKTIHPENIIGHGLERFWLEDESQRIGLLNIPKIFFDQMRDSDLYFLEIPFEKRLEYLVETYGKFEREKLVNAIMHIQKRLGGLETKMAINYLLENNVKNCFSILLKYYDKLYSKGLHNRINYEDLLNIIPCKNVNTGVNINKL
ncbi:MAG TPA: tRNA 2-selenouridine(34) synthase MnmH, partial [Chitinophagaceae bacterium]|nr:tRNA 2-selenouridine(34) synthase MnmH [Chitinophagaceae bacterium]